MVIEQLRSLPIGVPDWKEIRNENLFFVDKTSKIRALVTDQRKVFVARPRRMGKSILCSMLDELFTKGDANFEDTAIYGPWPESDRFPVIKISFIEVSGDNTDDFEIGLKVVLLTAYDRAGFDVDNIKLDLPLQLFLGKLSKASWGQRLVFLIDEWDHPLSVNLDKGEVFDAIQKKLRVFYTWLRNLDNVRFVLVTGIMRYTDSSLFTGQDIQDISMNPDYADLLGYTEDEVRTCYAPYLRAAAGLMGLSEDELLNQIKLHYDGFCFDYDAKVKLFCPLSINKFFAPVASKLDSPSKPYFGSYWMDSSNATDALRSYLCGHSLDVDTLMSMCGQHVVISHSDLSSPTKFADINIRQILVQSGYLSLRRVTDDTKDNSVKKRQYVCGFTNFEVASEFAEVLTKCLVNNVNYDASSQLGVIHSALLAGDFERMLMCINELLCQVRFDVMASAQEKHYRTFIAMWLRSERIAVVEEAANNLGSCDLVVTTPHRIYVVELKRLYGDSVTDENIRNVFAKAEQQVDDKGYSNNILDRSKPVTGVAVVIADRYRQIVGWRTFDEYDVVHEGFIKPLTLRNKHEYDKVTDVTLQDS